MKPQTPTPGGRLRRVWTEGVWPVLVGLLAAIGLFAASGVYGPAGLLAIYVTLALFSAMIVYGVCWESGVSGTRVVRIGLEAALAVMVLVGLSQLSPGYGWLIAAGAAATSPHALRLLARVRGAHPTAAPAPASSRPDQAMIDRRFEEIVSQLVNDPSWRHDSA